MASYVTPKKNVEFIFYMGLVSQSTGQFQANPTLAAGDVKVATDDGAPANISTLPTVDADFTKRIKVTLSTGEMNGDNVTIIFSDAAGAEWDDAIINIQTSARQIDDLAYPTTSGRSIDVDASGGVEVGAFQAGAITAAAIATGAIDADALAADAVTEIWAGSTAPTAGTIADAVWDEAQSGHTTAGTFGRYVDSQLATIQADTDNIQTRLPAALSGDGFIKADLKSIEDELTSGNNATLNLKQLNVSNNTGDAVLIQASGAGNDAITLNSSNGKGIFITSADDGMQISSTDGYGIQIFGDEALSALYLEGGIGMEVYGTVDAGAYIWGAGTAPGIDIQSAGTGKSINAPDDIALPSGDLDDQLQAIDNFIDTEVTAIKAKTDQLTFTNANQVDANIQAVNDTNLTGNGSSTPWGPA